MTKQVIFLHSCGNRPAEYYLHHAGPDPSNLKAYYQLTRDQAEQIIEFGVFPNNYDVAPKALTEINCTQTKAILVNISGYDAKAEKPRVKGSSQEQESVEPDNVESDQGLVSVPELIPPEYTEDSPEDEAEEGFGLRSEVRFEESDY